MGGFKEMKALITGITGLVGSHLAEYLSSKQDVEIFGFKRWRSRQVDLPEGLIYAVGDINDPGWVYDAVGDIEPDWVVHLAAQSYPRVSFGSPYVTLETNIGGTLNILEALRRINYGGGLLIASSSAVYGYAHVVPTSEDESLKPLSPYAVSKVAQEMLAMQYFESYGIRCYIARLFSQAGPGQGEESAIQTFARQALLIKKGKQSALIHVGNLDAKRDYTDVRDTAKALWLMMEKCSAGQTYNIGSGKTVRIGNILDMVLDKTGVKAEIHVQKARLRPTDEPIVQADISKFYTTTAWEPSYTLDDTIDSILNYWEKHL